MRLNQVPKACRGRSRFHLVRKIGAGGLGVVYLARDRILKRQVAVKIARRESPWRAPSQDRFLKECRATARLRHPGIPEIYASGRLKNGRRFYAMRLIRGTSLAQQIADFHGGRLGKPRASYEQEQRSLLGCFQAICETVHAAHDSGYLHLDLKPQNVMVEPTGATFVVDWGHARRFIVAKSECGLNDLTSSVADAGDNKVGNIRDVVASAKGGTPEFMAPEQVAGHESRFQRSTDVYALGGILHCILTGMPPRRSPEGRASETRWQSFMRSKSLWSLLENDHISPGALETGPLERPNVPRELASICRKALALKESDRYSTARELHDEISRWKRRDIVLAHAGRYRWGERFIRYLAQRPRMVLPTFLGTTVFLVFLGLFAWQWGTASRAEERAEAATDAALNCFHGNLNALNSAKVLAEFHTPGQRQVRAQILVKIWKEMRKVAQDLPRNPELIERLIIAANDFTETFAETVGEDLLAGTESADVALSAAEAGVFYSRELLKMTGNTARSLQLLQIALKNHAKICSERRSYECAKKSAHERIECIELLRRLYPGLPGTHELSFNAHLRLAAVYQAGAMEVSAVDIIDKFANAWKHLEIARDIRSYRSSGNSFRMHDLIALEQQSGIISHKRGEMESAMEFHDRALQSCRQFAIDPPVTIADDWREWSALQELQGRALNGKGLTLRGLNEQDPEKRRHNVLQAVATHEEALRLRCAVEERCPWLWWPRRDIAMSWGNLADAHCELENLDEELHSRHESLRVAKPLLIEYPSIDSPRGLWGVQAARLTMTLYRRVSDAEAISVFREAVNLMPDIEQAEWWSVAHQLNCATGFCLLASASENPESEYRRVREILNHARELPAFSNPQAKPQISDFPLLMDFLANE
ncbi:MAG: serine/threonine protein kinase [Planctomycetes bacterium]|nr:serine/threonine protein kinase [Planctomycetota bacterium]